MHLLQQVASGRAGAGVNGTKLCVCVRVSVSVCFHYSHPHTGGQWGEIQRESDTKGDTKDDNDDDDVPQLLHERTETCSLRIIWWSWQQAVFLDACWSWLGRKNDKESRTTR